MLVIFQTLLDTEQWRNIALSKEFLKKGDTLCFTLHSARHLRYYKKAGLEKSCIYCQPRIAQKIINFRAHPLIFKKSLKNLITLRSFDYIRQAVRDDYIFINKSKISGLLHFAAAFEFYDSFFKKMRAWHNKIIYISEMGYLYRHAAELAAENNNIGLTLIESARMAGRIAFLNKKNSYRWLDLNKNYQNIRALSTKEISRFFPDEFNKALNFIKLFYNKGMISASEGWDETRHITMSKALNSINYFFRHIFEEKLLNPYTKPTFLITSLKRKIVNKISNISLVKNLVYTHLNSITDSDAAQHLAPEQGQYVFFPLPVPWETTIRWRAPKFDNHLETIINLRKNIPSKYALYVKEHPVDRGGTSLETLYKISRIPGVFLIDPVFDSRQLIKNSSFVITVNSTAGFEAILMGKTPITLAPAFYDIFNMSLKADNPAQIPGLLKNIISKNSADITGLDKKSRALKIVTSMILSSIEAHFDYSTKQEFKKYSKKHNILQIVNAIYNHNI